MLQFLAPCQKLAQLCLRFKNSFSIKAPSHGEHLSAISNKQRRANALVASSYCEGEMRPVQCLVTLSYSFPLLSVWLGRPRWRNCSRLR